MKYLFTLIALSTMLFSSNIDWNSDYNKALKEAKAQNKDVYMLITSQTCKWCRKFESVTLQDKSVIKRLKEQYTLLHIDRDKNYFPEKFKSKRVPRHYFITNKGQIIYSFLGFWEKDDFFSFLHDVDDKR
jgi:thioredoxin-related protein